MAFHYRETPFADESLQATPSPLSRNRARGEVLEIELVVPERCVQEAHVVGFGERDIAPSPYVCYAFVRRLEMTESKITAKFQTTVPKEVRTKLHLRPGDVLRWEVVDGDVRMVPARRGFLERQGSIRVGPGSAVEDVRKARKMRGRDAP